MIKKVTERLMKYVNICIQNRAKFSRKKYKEIMILSSLDNEHRNYLMKLPKKYPSLTKLNRAIFNYNETLHLKAKHCKSMKKFRNKESNQQLNKDFIKYRDYIYALISTKTYKSKIPSSGKKVKLLEIANIFGHDNGEAFKDLTQEGCLYLWEGLKKYGVLPEKAKNFNGRLNEGFKRKCSSKSTFVFGNLRRSYINLSKKASSKKFTHIPVEFDPEILGD